MTNKKRILFTLFSAFLLVSCASKAPLLVAKNGVTPPGIDLSGSFQLRLDPHARRLPPQEEGIRIEREQSRRSRPENSRIKRSNRGMSVQVFIENGENIKLTQTEHGLFISYDRSIVEEFTFGEVRMVSIGPIEAQRVSGWEGTTFVAETMDSAGNLFRETWGLRGTDELVRSVRLMEGDKEAFSQQQIFDRK